jgi:thioredoxin reductase (NADPH)
MIMGVKIMYDVIVVGAGPTGLAASIYCANSGLRTLVLESKKEAGGRMLRARCIINYPGFPKKVTGRELANKMIRQAEKTGVEFQTSEEVIHISCKKDKFVETKKDAYYFKALILATGAGMMGLGMHDETWIGDGVSYCLECSEPLMKEMDIIVIGDTERAVDEAIYLGKIAKHLRFVNHANLIAIKPEVKEELEKNRIELIEDFVGEAVKSEPPHKQLVLSHLRNSTHRELTTNFILVVSSVNPFVSVLRKADIATHRAGCIAVDEFGRTNIERVYAAGSCSSTMKDIIPSCVGDGTTIAACACLYVKNKT